MFWSSTACISALSLVFLALAGWIAPRSWQDKASSGRERGVARVLRQFQFGNEAVRVRHRRRLLETNPVAWLCGREPYKEAMVLGAMAVLGVIWVWGLTAIRRYWVEMSCIPTALILHTLLKGWAAGEASRRFSEDRASGALELLLATPLSVKQILDGQRLALLRQFIWPTLGALLADTALMVAGLHTFIDSDREAWVGMWLAGMAMLVWDLYALSWVGPWVGLHQRQMSRAASQALIRVCVLPWLGFLGLLSILGIMDAFNYPVTRRLTPGFFIFSWFLIGAVNNLLFSTWARTQLQQQFRSIATERFGPKNLGAWGRWLGTWWMRRK